MSASQPARGKWGIYVGGTMVALFLLTAIIGPLVAPFPVDQQHLDQILLPPSHMHWLGTDDSGRDVLSQMLYGARLAVLLSVVTVLLCLTVGAALGVLAGYVGGLLDEAIMRLVDVLLAFPGILLNLAIVAIVPNAGLGVFVFALLINGWVGYARVARGQVLALRDREFVVAARALGLPPFRIMWRHVLPMVMSPLLVQATFGIGGVILIEASLAFLGIGRLRLHSWGSILAHGTEYVWLTSLLALVPGIAIAMVVLGCNLLGDGLRDKYDPKLSRR